MLNDTKNLNAVARRARMIDMPDGSKIELRALVLSDWAQIEEEAVQAAKRELLLTYTRNLDLLPEPLREAMLREAFRRAEEMRGDTLPTAEVLFPLTKEDGTPDCELVPQPDGSVKAIQRCVPVRVGYAKYWLESTTGGRLFSIWLSMRASQPGLTYQQAIKIWEHYKSERLVAQAAETVGEISRPTLGNADPPQPAKAAGEASPANSHPASSHQPATSQPAQIA